MIGSNLVGFVGGENMVLCLVGDNVVKMMMMVVSMQSWLQWFGLFVDESR